MITDNYLFAALISAINSQLSSWPFEVPVRAVVQQRQQPTMQGVPSGPTIFVEKLYDFIHGSPSVKYGPAIDGKAEETEKQVYATTFQFMAFIEQTEKDDGTPTASDLLDAVRFILQRRSTIISLKMKGISVQRVLRNNNPYFTNDKTRQEASPTFDLVVTYEKTAPAVLVDVITDVTLNIHQVP